MTGRTIRGGALIAVGALFLLTLAAPAAGAPRPGGADFSCKASAIRVATKVPAALTVEPFVANAADAPCVAENAGLIDPTTVGPVTADVVSATTSLTPENLAAAPPAEGDNATARASVTNPAIALPGLAISAAVLTATASYTCQGGQPVPGGAPQVTNLVINGNSVTVPPGPLTIPLGPLGSLELNQTVQEPNRITTRAFNLTTPVVDIVIAEATADIAGNPCAAPPQCSDTTDNDGDGLIDANDPGCLSGPGGTYDPADDDERDTECSDGVDNDRDGRIDFPADRGCSSSTDDSERTAPGTSRIATDPSAIARLGVRGPCVRRSFAALVTGRSISRVVFSLDGRRVGTDTSSPFRTRLAPAAPGRHRVTARVTFLTDSGTRSRTLSFQFVRCPPRVRLTG